MPRLSENMRTTGKEITVVATKETKFSLKWVINDFTYINVRGEYGETDEGMLAPTIEIEGVLYAISPNDIYVERSRTTGDNVSRTGRDKEKSYGQKPEGETITVSEFVESFNAGNGRVTAGNTLSFSFQEGKEYTFKSCVLYR